VDELDPSYKVFRQRQPMYWLTLPLITLLVVIGIVSGLVFGGVIQGDETRTGPAQAPTTQATVQITP
jgi:hypothetical protein